MIIYCITNTITMKSYVGQSIFSLKKRWRQHIYDSKRRDTHFYRAIRKYPIDSWKLNILEEFDDITLLNEREKYWILQFNSFNNGYNSDTGGGNGKIISEETRKKKSGKNHPLYGIGHKPETIEKIKKSKKGQSVGNNNPMYGSTFIWITNGEKNKRHIKEKVIPENWKKGKTQKTKRVNYDLNHLMKLNERKSKKVIIENTIYASYAEAGKKYKLSAAGIRHRILSKKFPEWNYYTE